jgi:hypothetical protein|tara:strand:+ start:475 stop:1314 length:840 start_codon:yes stop_codon:yes gene_type:complete
MANKVGLGTIIKNIGGSAINRTLSRLTGAGLRGGASDSRLTHATAKWSGRSDKTDWRVRLQVPYNSPLQSFFFDNNKLLAPLYSSRGFFWPLTPSMIIQHTANYNAMEQIHSNYPHYAYQNSQVDQMNVIGEFPVQNHDDAKYWVAVIAFLRTATKMFFGSDEEQKGSPPPILHLSGYGEHMFNKVPVVINTFNVELRAGIDYISTKQNSTPYKRLTGADAGFDIADIENMDQTWAPTLSNISVLITPIYSRDSVKTFSMKKFVRGELSGKGANEVGFI